MNRKLILGAVAGVAAIGLAVGGTTYAAYSDFGQVDNNSVGAGILSLQLNGNNKTAVAPLAFGSLAPGQYGTKQAIWVASSDAHSVPSADLYVRLTNLVDLENGCATDNSEQQADPTCATANDPGELSRVINMIVESYAAPSSEACKGYVSTGPGQPGDPGPVLKNTVLKNEIGNLADPADRDVDILISDPAHPLTAGQGVCLVWNSYWPTSKTGTVYGGLANLPDDNAAQGDSLTFSARLDLIQHTTGANPAPATLP